VERAIRQPDRDGPAADPALDQQVDHVILVEEADAVLDALLVQRLQDHVTGAVGCMTGAPNRFAGHSIGMPAKRALGDLTIRRPVKRQAHVFQLIDSRHGLITHELDGVLVAQVIRAFNCIVGVPFGMVFLLAADRKSVV
jgi:hypothetical protein